MSIILDALDKSDREGGGTVEAPQQTATVVRVESDRQGQGNAEAARIQTPHGVGHSVAGRSWSRLLWPVLAMLAVALAVYVWLRSSAPSAEPAAATQIEEQALLVQRESAGSQAEPAAVPVNSQSVAANVPAAKSRSDEAVAALYDSRRTTAPVTASQQAAGSVASRDGDASARTQPIDVDALAAAARRELAQLDDREPVIEHAAPLIGELDQRTKDEIPSVFFSFHHWSTLAGEREVVLNGERRREGDRIASGLTLVEILEDSIVLDYRGTAFRLRSLSSWVNL